MNWKLTSYIQIFLDTPGVILTKRSPLSKYKQKQRYNRELINSSWNTINEVDYGNNILIKYI